MRCLKLKPEAQRLVDELGLQWEATGLSRIAGRIAGLLILQAEPLSLDEIASALCVSKGSVSHEARRLAELGLLRPTTKPGDRRDYYVVAPDLPAALLRNRAAEVQRLDEAMKAAAALAGTPQVVVTRICKFADFHRRILGVIQEFAATYDPEGDPAPPSNN